MWKFVLLLLLPSIKQSEQFKPSEHILLGQLKMLVGDILIRGVICQSSEQNRFAEGIAMILGGSDISNSLHWHAACSLLGSQHYLSKL